METLSMSKKLKLPHYFKNDWESIKIIFNKFLNKENKGLNDVVTMYNEIAKIKYFSTNSSQNYCF